MGPYCVGAIFFHDGCCHDMTYGPNNTELKKVGADTLHWMDGR